LLHEVVARVRRLEEVPSQTREAFGGLSPAYANSTLNLIADDLPEDAGLGQRIAPSVPDQRLAIATQTIVCDLMMALEMLVIVNEVTINRSVEPGTVAPAGIHGFAGDRQGHDLLGPATL